MMTRYTLAALADAPDLDSREDERMIPAFLVMTDVRPDDAEWCPECQTGIVETTASIYPFAIRFRCSDSCGWEA